MLWPCHWDFLNNLQVVLDAIGGKLQAERPFAACGRNITSLSNRVRMLVVADVLRAFWRGVPAEEAAGGQILASLGEPTDVKRWLAASLDKTIRLQLDPPIQMQQATALAGPDWIYQDAPAGG